MMRFDGLFCGAVEVEGRTLEAALGTQVNTLAVRLSAGRLP